MTVIVITAFGTVESAVEAMRIGTYDYVTKPLDFDALVLVVHRAMERQTLLEEVRTLRSALDQHRGFEGIAGRAKNFLHALDQAARVSQHDATVLNTGETGTGKELLARAIHNNSRRRTKAFVPINYGAIPKDLIESELFGYVRGSFRGATANKQGRIEAAEGGTLFLDEVGELSLEAQVKMLRVLQEGVMSLLPLNRRPDAHHTLAGKTRRHSRIDRYPLQAREDTPGPGGCASVRHRHSTPESILMARQRAPIGERLGTSAGARQQRLDHGRRLACRTATVHGLFPTMV
jgi:hypothetical protein